MTDFTQTKTQDVDYLKMVLSQQVNINNTLTHRVEELISDCETLTIERDFYRQKFEEQQVKLFLSNFTQEEQMKILEQIN